MTSTTRLAARRYQRIISRLVTRLQRRYDPDRIILFGSAARGDMGPDSDIDLLIIKETDRRPLERMREVYAAAYSPRGYLALDPLVLTPAELALRIQDGDPFVRDILREGRLLYERL